MYDTQKIITEIILYRIRKVTGGILLFVGFFFLVGAEDTAKYSDDPWVKLIVIGFILIAIGAKMSEIFQWEYYIEGWTSIYAGAISYSFTEHSWIKAYRYRNNDDWMYVRCDIYGRVLSKPIRTRSSFLGFKWYK